MEINLTPRTTSTVVKVLLLSLLLFIPLLVHSHPEKTIALTQIIDHPSLNQAKAGLLDELKDRGYEKGKNLIIHEENAQNSLANAAIIAKKLVTEKPDAIVSFSTPSTQTVVNAAKNQSIPVVFSSVTDPVAAGIIKDIAVPEQYLTGAIDFPPLKETASFIKTLLPQVKRVGILYNPGEANSVKMVKLMKTYLAVQGILVLEATITNTNGISSALNALAGKVQAIYLPSDNTVFSALPLIVKTSRKLKIPVFSSDPDSVKQGIFACIGYSQYEVGRAAGKLLAQILTGETHLKIEKPALSERYINCKTAAILGISIDVALSPNVKKIDEVIL